MILFGKCKEDFNKWLYENDECYFTDESMQMYNNTLFVNWFDSVGICIEIDVSRFNDEYGFDCGFYYDNFNDYIAIDGFFKSRQEATQEAIKKATEIYNEMLK